MIAFHGKPETKQFYLGRVLEHQQADEIVKGTYWEDGKGCAVGCTLHSSDHKAYESEMGVPEWLALVEDRIFEGMSNERAKKFPAQFIESINVGAELEKIKAPFMIFILQSALEHFDHEKDPACKKAIDDVIGLWRTDPEGPAAAWSAARSAAWSAAESAAWSAAESAARSAAESAAESAAYEKFADKLLELMRECK